MRILYGAPPSPFVRKVRIVLAEKELPYTLEPVVHHLFPPSFDRVSTPFFQTSPPGAPKRARGVTRIIRHPVFAAFGLWGLAHALVNGYLSDLIFFGGWLIFWFVGGMHQDARKRVLEAARFAPFYAETSLLPFGAIVAGRNRLVLREVPLLGVATALGVATVLYAFHGRLFGG